MTEIRFTLLGPARVQKNNLQIRKSWTKNGKERRWVGHTSSFKAFRDKVSIDLYKQYRSLQYSKPIDYNIEVDFIFYLTGGEADLDNLPAAFLDAMMGIKVKGVKSFQILQDDKLVKKLRAEKITMEDGYDGKPRTEITIREYRRTEGV